jgi:hypothetical protein
MEILLDLNRHCIETASKKKYEHLIRQYLKASYAGKEKSTIENQIDALKYFLEKADFPGLRNHGLNSCSDSKKAVLIVPQHFKNMYIRFNKKSLYPVWKNK